MNFYLISQRSKVESRTQQNLFNTAIYTDEILSKWRITL